MRLYNPRKHKQFVVELSLLIIALKEESEEALLFVSLAKIAKPVKIYIFTIKVFTLIWCNIVISKCAIGSWD